MKIVNMSSILVLCAGLWYGCSTAPKGEIAATANPNEEIQKMENDLNEGFSKQYDILASETFSKSFQSWLEAKKDLEKNQDQKEILDDLRYAKGYYEESKVIAEDRREKMEPVLLVRQKAVDQGILNYPRLKEDWNKVENQTRDLAVKKAKNINPDDLKELQDKYADLELKVIKEKNLGDAMAKIESAKDDRAKSLAPKSLESAQIALMNAEGTLAANRADPSASQTEVDKANESAERLRKVMGYTTQKKKKFSEAAAIAIVMQEEEKIKLEKQVANQGKEIESQAEESMAQGAMINTLANRVENQKDKLNQSRDQLALQKAIDSATSKFSKDEADIYQQGEKLIIRLKSINFSSGQAKLPANSDSLLSKVEEVADELSASNVVVQGHTDSIGSKNLNQKLSESRAQAVADKLKSDGLTSNILTEGYGDMNPLTSNKTAAGRAQNRRIDIVITPAL